ncbi:hypothetical protein D3C71_1356730 [compost metagenome]
MPRHYCWGAPSMCCCATCSRRSGSPVGLPSSSPSASDFLPFTGTFRCQRFFPPNKDESTTAPPTHAGALLETVIDSPIAIDHKCRLIDSSLWEIISAKNHELIQQLFLHRGQKKHRPKHLATLSTEPSVYLDHSDVRRANPSGIDPAAID